MMENFHRIQPPVFPVEKVVIPEINMVRLNNNVPVYLIDAGTEDIMRMEVTFRAGQVKENLPLLASTTNMMLSEGSQNFTSEELNRTLDYHGAFLNLSCDKDRAGMVIFFLNKHVKKIIELSREILFRPLFPDNEYNSLMKKKLRWFLVNREKVQNIAMDQFFESVFGKTHPYGQQVRENDFSNLSPSHLRNFHSEYYTIENMAIIISGKIAHNTIDILNQYIGDISSYKNNPEIITKKPEGSPEKKIHLIKPGAVQTAIRIGSATINKRHPDYPGLKILDSILGGYFGSRLMKNIREEKGYTYGISSGVSSLDLTGYKIISTDVSPKNCQKVLDEIYKEIRLLQNEPVKNSEMELVRNYMSGEMLRMFDGPFALAESFRSAWEFGLDNNYYYRLAEKIRSIDPDEITWLARTYYNIDELYEVTVGKE